MKMEFVGILNGYLKSIESIESAMYSFDTKEIGRMMSIAHYIGGNHFYLELNEVEMVVPDEDHMIINFTPDHDGQRSIMIPKKFEIDEDTNYLVFLNLENRESLYIPCTYHTKVFNRRINCFEDSCKDG